MLPNPAKQYLVKRVIGIAGDRIVCCTDKKLTINGTPVDEPYIFKGNNPSEMTFDITVDPGKIWVMGDHRGASADSRYHQDDINRSIIKEQVEMGVAVRMACLKIICGNNK